MTPKLLRWFTSYAPLGDGSKLAFDDSGNILEADLLSFDARLREDWGKKAVPAGIAAELKREATGRCALCPTTQALEQAHVNRKGVECAYYWQHPHNLILLCAVCHARYDSPADNQITHDVVEHRKGVLQAGLLQAINMEIETATRIESVLAPVRQRLQGSKKSFWSGAEGEKALQQLARVAVSVGTPPLMNHERSDLGSLTEDLLTVSPLAAAKVASLERENGLGTDKDAWLELDAPSWLCIRDSEIAMVESASCPECGMVDFQMHGEEPSYVDGSSFPVAYFCDGHETSTPECPTCGHSPMEWEFQSLCGYCSHQVSKND